MQYIYKWIYNSFTCNLIKSDSDKYVEPDQMAQDKESHYRFIAKTFSAKEILYVNKLQAYAEILSCHDSNWDSLVKKWT